MSSGTPGEVCGEMIDGLAALVRFVEQLPAELAADALRYAFDRINIWATDAATVASIAKAGAAAGADVTKEITGGVDGGDGYAGVMIRFGSRVALYVYTDRAQICQRVVVASHEVIEDVPDPDLLATLPRKAVRRVVEDVQWYCGPLLSAAAPGKAGEADAV